MTLLIVVERVLAEAHDDDAAHGVAAAVEIGDAATDGRTDRTRPSSATRIGVPASVAPTTTFSMSPIVLEVAEPAHHVLALRQFHGHRADVVVGA